MLNTRVLQYSLKPKSCPSGHPNIVLDSGRDLRLILHENFCALDNPLAPTLETERRDSIDEHESFTFETLQLSFSILKYSEFVSLSITCLYVGHNHLLILTYKLFKRIVVDAYVYRKYCKSHGWTVVLTLQLERK